MPFSDWFAKFWLICSTFWLVWLLNSSKLIDLNGKQSTHFELCNDYVYYLICFMCNIFLLPHLFHLQYLFISDCKFISPNFYFIIWEIRRGNFSRGHILSFWGTVYLAGAYWEHENWQWRMMQYRWCNKWCFKVL